MRNLLLTISCLVLFLINCTPTQKVSKTINCCNDIEVFKSADALQIPKSYNRNCGTTQCLQLAESQNLDCISFKLYTRFGQEIVVFQSEIPIRMEDLTKELNKQFAIIEQTGVYVFTATYKLEGQCFQNKGQLNIL